MAKLYWIWSTMGAGKSLNLIQTAFNYEERGMQTLLLTSAIDDRHGKGKITSRLGISRDAEIFSPDKDLYSDHLVPAAQAGMGCVLVDEGQFLSRRNVEDLARAVDTLNLPVMVWGLRTDFLGNLFEGSNALFSLADELREMRTLCHCGKKATMVLRRDANGNAVSEGPQVQIGGNDSYTPLCRKHWAQAIAQSRSSSIT
ncbi:Thymidine kinase [Roseobacter fucihabitans]|uniref:Thymidine kinase n=1 Tax=Roseobacter fucihabitans TaxID=1537242 RepID=A0ABZ2BVU8_9RHOB|nr:thymidine kinase [Roseobacter litoralis]MBC6964598.1 Thymidine kinase [Roseobacter litoralis]